MAHATDYQCYMGDYKVFDLNKHESVTERLSRLSDDQFYRALSSTQRRRIMYILLDKSEKTVSEIATELAEWEGGNESTMETPTDQGQIVTALIHQHFPLLAEADMVAYDRETRRATIKPLDPFIRDLIRWSVDVE